jgi:D-glycero-D-manno-heptose 1,7-bisphosphate phosphatase
MRKAAFLDRDGVLNRKASEGQYVTRWDEMEFLPGTREAIRLLNDAGFLVVVVSNQRCVAKGLVSVVELEAMHARMRREYLADGARIDAIYYCPHENYPPCTCRKPQPGMILDAAEEYNIDLAASWMIGDSAHDVEAGRSAGCSTARLMAEEKSGSGSADVVSGSLLDAVQKILQIS